jgi:hypothetical protein
MEIFGLEAFAAILSEQGDGSTHISLAELVPSCVEGVVESLSEYVKSCSTDGSGGSEGDWHVSRTVRFLQLDSIVGRLNRDSVGCHFPTFARVNNDDDGSFVLSTMDEGYVVNTSDRGAVGLIHEGRLPSEHLLGAT